MTGIENRLVQQQWNRVATAVCYGGLFEAALGIAFILWGDSFLPSAESLAFGLSTGKLIGAALLLIAAPTSFAICYLFRTVEARKWPDARGSVKKL